MGTWIMFVVWLFINWLVNVVETFTGILKYYFLQMNAAKFVKCILKRTTLNSAENSDNSSFVSP